ncbi:MAG: ribosome silencing factor [Cyanobacteriota bacterium]|jgi:ribosome-associated protein
MAEAVNPAPTTKPSPDPSRPRLDPDDSKALALLAAEACDDRKAADIVLIHVEEISSIADWFVIATGYSDVQVRAIARSVEDKIEEESGGRLPLRKEGQTEGRWVLLDYGEVIVHALTPEERSYYDLESFWGHGEKETYLGSAQTPTA